MARLYGNEDAFWTSDDNSTASADNESDESEAEDGADEVDPIRTVPQNTPLSTVYAEFIGNTLDTAGSQFVEGPREIPKSTIIAPKRKTIRKGWVIHDTLPTDSFAKEIPDPAMTYPFELDDFQKRAIRHVNRREHTFVAAHTSAGKTVVAEYAVALAAKRGRRAVYTSPIKALSNQKYREFTQKFDSVGIITGDVSVNPGAQCLIATTEILRTMLYRGDAILNQLDVVIFDEVHYVNDADRGVVWEEVIIMLPRDVCLVMLSATVPNYKEFADWIGMTKRREVFAISTTKRPTPLKHFLWVDNKEFLVMDQAKFRVEAFNEIYRSRREAAKVIPVQNGGRGGPKAKAAASRGGRGGHTAGAVGNRPGGSGAKQKTDSYRLQSLIKRLELNSQLPVVVFCFSRKRCEQFPSSMTKLDLLSQDDRSKVHVFVKDSFSALRESDRDLPQVRLVSGFLNRGVGVHHGGLLPIVKECVEILFQRGLVRVLFATETFAMGVNMPARSVIFATVEKHDGQKMRTLLASEYTQMAGRAGRRGIDLFGSVYILCCDNQLPDQKEITKLMMEKANPLQSRFRLTYHMLLQLSSYQNLQIEDMMALSFREHSRARRVPTLKRDHARIMKEIDSLDPIQCICGDTAAIEKYVKLEIAARHLANQLHWCLWRHQYSIESANREMGKTAAPFCPGRIVAAHSLPIAKCSCIGTILSVDSIPILRTESPTFQLLVLTPSPTLKSTTEEGEDDNDAQKKQIRKLIQQTNNPYGLQSIASKAGMKVLASGVLRGPASKEYLPGASFGYYLLSSVPLDLIGLITPWILETDIAGCNYGGVDDTKLLLAAKALDRLNISFEGKWQPLTLAKNLKQIEVDFVDTLLKQKDLIEEINRSPCHSCSLKDKHFSMVLHNRDCADVKKEIERLLRVESLDLYEEMQLKYQILERRQFVDKAGGITLKGQVAAAITSTDEITLTEALFGHVFHTKTPAETAALLSCFVFPDKTIDVPSGPTQGIVDGRDAIERLHSEIENEMKVIGIHFVHEDWWKICNFGLSSVAFQWAEGKSFSEIMETTELQEGTIVRSILRLDELIRKLKAVAKILLDDAPLEKLMDETSSRIRRDVIFAISLYLQ